MSVGGTQKRDKKRWERETVKELKQPLRATLGASRGMPCHRIALTLTLILLIRHTVGMHR